MTGDPPRGTVTFLFTDVEGSTRRWTEHPEAMATALADHDRIVAETIADHDGYVFTTAGDSFAAAFADPSRAAAAAVAIQRHLAATDFSAVDGLSVRIGLHTGGAIVRDGDYFGPEVNLAARVMAAGHGGQILCTAATAALGDQHGTDLGAHHLRDVAAPVDLHQLIPDGLAADFPPLRTTATTNASLPLQSSSFVGRTEEIAAVRKLLDATRLLTLTGTGGTGKTRLAVEAAAQLAPTVKGRVVFADLSTATDTNGVTAAVAGALDLVGDLTGDLRSQVIRTVTEHVGLLLVDNCEHVIDDAADLVADLLAAGLDLRVVATSREQLDLDGEQVYRVPPLTTGDDRGAPGVRLFLDRALTLDPDLDLGPDDRAVIAEICDRLDGIPLAIELAAARTRVLSPADILERLTDRFTLLTGGRRRTRQRQQTLEAAIGWSYDLLDDDEQRAFRQLGVFAPGFDIHAAAAVLDLPVPAAIDTVDALVSKSMLIRLAGPDARFRMLETLRAYAETRLADAAETTDARDRHLAHYASRPYLADNGFYATRSDADGVIANRDNLLLAFDWAESRGDGHGLTRMAVGLQCLGDIGLIETARDVLDRTLAADLDPDDRVDALDASIAHCILENSPVAVEHVRAAIELLDSGAVTRDLEVRRARLHVVRAFVTSYSFAFDNFEHDADQLDDLAVVDANRHAAEPRVEASLHVVASMVYAWPQRWDDVLDRARRGLAMIDLDDAPLTSEAIGRENEMLALTMLGRLDEAVELARALADDRRGAFASPPVIAAVIALSAAGHLDEARRKLLQVADVALDIEVQVCAARS